MHATKGSDYFMMMSRFEHDESFVSEKLSWVSILSIRNVAAFFDCHSSISIVNQRTTKSTTPHVVFHSHNNVVISYRPDEITTVYKHAMDYCTGAVDSKPEFEEQLKISRRRTRSISQSRSCYWYAQSTKQYPQCQSIHF